MWRLDQLLKCLGFSLYSPFKAESDECTLGGRNSWTDRTKKNCVTSMTPGKVYMDAQNYKIFSLKKLDFCKKIKLTKKCVNPQKNSIVLS